MSLCHSFQELARWTWFQLGRSNRLSAPFNEETITESILLELKDRHPNDIHVVSFSKQQEQKLGADWEFWFIDRDCKRSFGWRVQAKRLYLPQERYDALKPAETAPDSQIQKLISMAKSSGLAPVYTFYNHVDDPTTVQKNWKCPTFKPGHDLFGCSIARAEHIHKLGSKKFDDVAAISLPWHCAVCCTAAPGLRDLPTRVASVTNSFLDFGLDGIETVEQSEYFPRYVRLMSTDEGRREAAESERDYDEFIFRVSEAAFKEISGVAVFRETV